MRKLLLATALTYCTTSAAFAETSSSRLAALLGAQKAPPAQSLIIPVTNLTCKCGNTSKEFDITCTAPKTPTCVCSNPGNNPSATCI
jgi:hypothetical protein